MLGDRGRHCGCSGCFDFQIRDDFVSFRGLEVRGPKLVSNLKIVFCSKNPSDELRNQQEQVGEQAAARVSELAAWKRQNDADEVLALGKGDAQLTGAELNVLIKYKKQGKGHSSICTKTVPIRRREWIDTIKNIPNPARVEEPSADDDVADQVMQVAIPTLEETRLGRARAQEQQRTLSVLESTTDPAMIAQIIAAAQAAQARLGPQEEEDGEEGINES